MDERQDDLTGKLIIGIDLGTTKSGVAAWSPVAGKVIMLADADGYDLTPSVAAWDRHQRDWRVGRAAKDLALESPGDAIYSIKRYIGRWFNDRAVLYGRPDLTYNLVSGGGGDPLRDVVADLGADEGQPLRLTAPEVSAKVLAKLRADAARALGVPLGDVNYAVITVPAYFNVLQRRATIEAGRLAGLEVVDILNEPTAAALAYSHYAPDLLGAEERRLLIFDLGGGTFDVSLLDAKLDEVGYAFYTHIVDGDTRLGGDDIDSSVARWLATEIERRYNHPVRVDDLVTRARLRRQAEQAKISLSVRDTGLIALPGLDLGSRGPFNAEIELSRAQLEKCAGDVLERASRITQRAVTEVAGMTWDQVDEIILVGGQTLMPAVQLAVKALSGKQPRVLERPQLAVALGAGEYAHILSLGADKFPENSLVNVIALPLGIRLDDSTFERLVEANATVPHTSRPFCVTTTEDNQPLVKVEVLQGPRGAKTADQCVSLGSIEMEVPPVPARTPKFEVVFDVKSDGTMKVIVTDTKRRRSETLDVITTGAVVLRDKPQEGA